MYRVNYEECKDIWDNKNHNTAIRGQAQYVKYACKKLGIVSNRHKEIKEYYNKYIIGGDVG